MHEQQIQVDVPWKYLNFFLEDDKELEHIGKEYESGRMQTSTCEIEGVSSSL